MKTADREKQIHGYTWSRNRAHGAVGQNRTRSIKWAEKQEKFRPKEMCFFLTSPFIEPLIQIHGVTWSRNRAHGAVGQNRTRSIKWAEKQEKFRPKEMCFFLTSPFIALIRIWRKITALTGGLQKFTLVISGTYAPIKESD